MGNEQQPTNMQENPKRHRSGLIVGSVLLVIGLILLLQNYFPQINSKLIGPIILIIVGIGFLINSSRK
jgi:hypothetical protein